MQRAPCERIGWPLERWLPVFFSGAGLEVALALFESQLTRLGLDRAFGPVEPFGQFFHRGIRIEFREFLQILIRPILVGIGFDPDIVGLLPDRRQWSAQLLGDHSGVSMRV